MPVFRRFEIYNQSSEIFNIPCYIKSFSLTNTSGTSIDAEVTITDADETPAYYIYAGAIASNDSVLYDVPIKILPGHKIFVHSNPSYVMNCYFTIE